MNRNLIYIFLITFFSILLYSCKQEKEEAKFSSCKLPTSNQRIWIGNDFWTNPLQDWQLKDGKIECLKSAQNRNVHLLTHRIAAKAGELKMSVRMSLENRTENKKAVEWIGFRVGIKGQFNDYRDDAVRGKGLNMGITTKGKLFLGKAEEAKVQLEGNWQDSVDIVLEVKNKEEKNILSLNAFSALDGKKIGEIKTDTITNEQLEGGLALVSDFKRKREKAEIKSAWFKKWILNGSKVDDYEERAFGPVLFTQYTLSRKVLKMTAQMPPIGEKDEHKAQLEIKEGENWKKVAEADIDKDARTLRFRLENWNKKKDTPYRVAYKLFDKGNKLKQYYYEGKIRKEPNDKEEIVVAAFTGNNDLGFPNTDIFGHVVKHNPDFLFFSGDQIYERVGDYGLQRSPLDKSTIDYLRKWYLYGWAYGEIMKDRPTVAIPDDHDVYHGNIWGCAGKATIKGNGSKAQDSGGYKQPPEWVNMVHRTQTSHLPDPYDPTPIKQGISVYYTSINYGGISFAVIADRMFKSAPKALLPKAEIDNGWAQNLDFDATKEADVKGAVMLGQRQLDFLDKWVNDWSNKTWMKILLSQTIFANVATLPEELHHDKYVPKLKIFKKGEYAENDRPVADFDSNGWPQTERNKAVKILRKGFALHLAGDQHLGSTIQYGTDEYGDGSYAFCVPSISNIWPRRWFPAKKSPTHKEGEPLYTGDFKDGFGNKMTVFAVSNPVFTGKKPENLYDRATGYGILRINRKTRDIKIECWDRFTDPSAEDAKQYAGWPIVINQEQNYSKKVFGYLPPIKVEGTPVVQLINEKTNEIVYTIRLKEGLSEYKAKVFEDGIYTLKMGEPEVGMKEHKGLKPTNE